MTSEATNSPRPPPGHASDSRSFRTSRAPSDSACFSPDDHTLLARASLERFEVALDLVESWRKAGHSLEDIYLEGVAASARLLGHWWSCDDADFAQVTIGSTNLQRLLHWYSDEFCAPGADQPTGLQVLLCTEPRAQHTMGAFMLGEFFRRRGWRVQPLLPQDIPDILAQLRRDWFDAVGLSLSSTRQLDVLAEALPRLREEAPNPDLRILVGGPLAHAHPESLRNLGVDLVSGDARATVDHLQALAIARRN